MLGSVSLASKALSLRGELAVGADLHIALDNDWSSKHSIVCHAYVEAIASGPVESVRHVLG